MSPYPGIQDANVPLLGRTRELLRIERSLTKDSADHVSVVGAPHIGKTTLLRHVAEVFRPGRDGYVTATFLDLRHHTPASDDAFRQRLASELKAALGEVVPEVAESIEPDDDPQDLADLLPEIFDYFEDDGGRLLVVMDGLDHFMANSDISKNLWDYLRDIAQKPTCTLVTGSRLTLLELCKNPESQTSEFWGLFRDPLVLGPFSADERDELLGPMLKVAADVEEAARKELWNWTGGHPALFALLAARVCDAAAGGAVDKGLVDTTAGGLVDGPAPLLQELWGDCSVEVQGDLHGLAVGAPNADSIPVDRLKFAAARGFVDDSGRKPRLSARMVEMLARAQGESTQDLKRLFAAEASYMSAIRAIPELRLAQLSGVPAVLRREVEGAVRDIETHPRRCLMSCRLIAVEALKLIYDVEAPGRQIPSAWMTAWQHSNNRWAMKVQNSRVPGNEGLQCALLEEITSTYGGKPKLAQRVSRSTYVLVEHVKQAGDLGNHPDGTITPAYAAACCLAAVELCERLSGELP